MFAPIVLNLALSFTNRIASGLTSVDSPMLRSRMRSDYGDGDEAHEFPVAVIDLSTS